MASAEKGTRGGDTQGRAAQEDDQNQEQSQDQNQEQEQNDG